MAIAKPNSVTTRRAQSFMISTYFTFTYHTPHFVVEENVLAKMPSALTIDHVLRHRRIRAEYTPLTHAVAHLSDRHATHPRPTAFVNAAQ